MEGHSGETGEYEGKRRGSRIDKPKILFIAEAVTLSHVARPAMLAQALDSDKFDVIFAADPRHNYLFPELADYQYDIWSISSGKFLNTLAKGGPLYSKRTLERYVEDDLELIDQVNPDLIVGDFRLSLSVSARLKNIKYAAISNVYWSVYSNNNYPVPQLPITRYLGVGLSQIMFNLFRPFAFALHCVPLNRVRRKYGLQSLGYDLRSVYTDADEVLLADIPEYFPIAAEASHHRYIGPVPWSPSGKRPSWWKDIDKTKPVVYVALGSSGRVELLQCVLEALAEMPVTVIATTAGRAELTSVPDNALVSDFVSGDEAASIASLVVCNGGSLATYQAIANGAPVLGIVSNLDQHLNMSYLSSSGIGEVVRSEKANVKEIRKIIGKILDNPCYRDATRDAQRLVRGYTPQKEFRRFVGEILDCAV